MRPRIRIKGRVKPVLLSLAMTAGLSLPVSNLYANPNDINTLEITSSAIKALPQCLDYELKAALCVWIKVSLSGVLVTITPKVRHKLPDFVVTAFTGGSGTSWGGSEGVDKTATPWTELRLLESLPARQIQQSALMKIPLGSPTIKPGSFSNAVTQGQNQNQNTRFVEVNVVGNPTIKLIQKEIKKLLGGASFLCDSNVKPLKPYYMSELDTVAWHMPKIEILKYPKEMIPGVREVSHSKSLLGGVVQTWGSIFPRTGFVLQQQLSKATAVASQRAVDIVLHKNQVPHVYKHYKVTGKATFIRHIKTPEVNKSWQMIKPKEQNFCEVFGSPGSGMSDWGDGKMPPKDDTRQGFSWNYWNEYECCMPGPGHLAFHYDF